MTGREDRDGSVGGIPTLAAVPGPKSGTGLRAGAQASEIAEGRGRAEKAKGGAQVGRRE